MNATPSPLPAGPLDRTLPLIPAARASLALAWVTLVLFCLSSVRALAEPGVTDAEIILGQTAVLSGPSQALGTGVKLGLEIAFKEINEAGGIAGRRITLVSKDDGYEHAKAADNARALINDDKVFALIGTVGTPTAAQIVPLCTAAEVPLIGPFTGAGALRSPFNPLIVNIRASYAQEMQRIATLLVDGQSRRRIACFYQDDAYGQGGLKALQTALLHRAITPCAVGSYVRNTTDVDAAVATIVGSSPEAVVLVGTYAACAQFIKKSRAHGLTETKFCNVSFVGTRALVAALGPAAEGVIISQVVPNPIYSQTPLSGAYRKALAKYAPTADPDWISFEGYLDGRVFAAAARRAAAPLTRKSLLAAFQATPQIEIEGLSMQFSPTNNQGSSEVFLTQVTDGKIVSLK